MFCYPSDISHFHPFGCPLGSQLGSLRQKCDPDKRAQNSHKSRLCFFTHQTFSIFIRLYVPWDPNLDPCGKSVVLAGAFKIHVKIVYVFYPSDDFHFHSFGCPLGFQLGSLLQKWDPDKCAQNLRKSRLCFFAHQTFPIFSPLVVLWGPSLDPCGKSVVLTGVFKIYIKVVYDVVAIWHFPFSFIAPSLCAPLWIFVTKVLSWWMQSKLT